MEDREARVSMEVKVGKEGGSMQTIMGAPVARVAHPPQLLAVLLPVQLMEVRVAQEARRSQAVRAETAATLETEVLEGRVAWQLEELSMFHTLQE